MKFSLFALATIVSVAAAQNLSGEPACATSCLLSAISAAGCAPTDVPCQCGLSAAVVGPCLIGACNPTDLSQAESVGLALCSSYSAAHGNGTTSTTSKASNGTTSSSVLSTTSGTSTTTVTAQTTSFTSTNSAATKSPTPIASTSTAGSPALMAGIGGAVGMLALVAAL